MRNLLLLLLLIIGLRQADCAEPENASAAFLSSLKETGLQVTWSHESGGTLRMVATNPARSSSTITVPAGLVCTSGDAVRVVVLREAVIAVPAATSVEAELPAAVLNATAAGAKAACTPVAERDARVDPLLHYVHGRPDVPRGTSQLAVLCLTSDLGIGQWEAFLRGQRGDDAAMPGLTPAEIVQAIDALGVLREIAPEKSFALAKDPELKLRALRNPWCRAKAMQLYGIALPEIPPGQAPDLGQLLHTKANDNCPVCRLRRGSARSCGRALRPMRAVDATPLDDGRLRCLELVAQ